MTVADSFPGAGLDALFRDRLTAAACRIWQDAPADCDQVLIEVGPRTADRFRWWVQGPTVDAPFNVATTVAVGPHTRFNGVDSAFLRPQSVESPYRYYELGVQVFDVPELTAAQYEIYACLRVDGCSHQAAFEASTHL